MGRKFESCIRSWEPALLFLLPRFPPLPVLPLLSLPLARALLCCAKSGFFHRVHPSPAGIGLELFTRSTRITTFGKKDGVRLMSVMCRRPEMLFSWRAQTDSLDPLFHPIERRSLPSCLGRWRATYPERTFPASAEISSVHTELVNNAR